jgi:hypothetical protein
VRFVTSGAGMTLDGQPVLTNNQSGVTLNGTLGGNGGGLTNLNAAQLSGAVPSGVSVPAANLTGVLPAISGASLTSLNASQLSSGTVPLARLSGLTSNQLDATTWQLATNLNGGNAASLGGLSSSNFWQLGGNNVAAGQFIGSTNNQPLEFRVNGQRGLRLEPTLNAANHSNMVNVVNGSSANSVSTGVYGATIAGGGAGNYFGRVSTNYAGADFGTVSGGMGNTSSGTYATVGGGGNNLSSGLCATVGGGGSNQATNDYATVPGGANNVAGGQVSFAAGDNAQALHKGAFVWSDSTGWITSSTADNSVTMRASGGYRFFTQTGDQTVAPGAQLLPGTTAWSVLSDRHAKKNIGPVNYKSVLDKLALVPVQQWNYNWEKNGDVPNLGPMAQDFKAAFFPGRDDKSISTLEFDGVELAAIQGLNQKLNEKDAEIQNLEKKLDELQAVIKQLVEKK